MGDRLTAEELAEIRRWDARADAKETRIPVAVDRRRLLAELDAVTRERDELAAKLSRWTAVEQSVRNACAMNGACFEVAAQNRLKSATRTPSGGR